MEVHRIEGGPPQRISSSPVSPTTAAPKQGPSSSGAPTQGDGPLGRDKITYSGQSAAANARSGQQATAASGSGEAPAGAVTEQGSSTNEGGQPLPTGGGQQAALPGGNDQASATGGGQQAALPGGNDQTSTSSGGQQAAFPGGQPDVNASGQPGPAMASSADTAINSGEQPHGANNDGLQAASGNGGQQATVASGDLSGASGDGFTSGSQKSALPAVGQQASAANAIGTETSGSGHTDATTDSSAVPEHMSGAINSRNIASDESRAASPQQSPSSVVNQSAASQNSWTQSKASDTSAGPTSNQQAQEPDASMQWTSALPLPKQSGGANMDGSGKADHQLPQAGVEAQSALQAWSHEPELSLTVAGRPATVQANQETQTQSQVDQGQQALQRPDQAQRLQQLRPEQGVQAPLRADQMQQAQVKPGQQAPTQAQSTQAFLAQAQTPASGAERIFVVPSTASNEQSTAHDHNDNHIVEHSKLQEQQALAIERQAAFASYLSPQDIRAIDDARHDLDPEHGANIVEEVLQEFEALPQAATSSNTVDAQARAASAQARLENATEEALMFDATSHQLQVGPKSAVSLSEQQIAAMREHDPSSIGGPYYGGEPNFALRAKKPLTPNEARRMREEEQKEDQDRRERRNRAWRSVSDAREAKASSEAEEAAAKFAAEAEQAKVAKAKRTSQQPKKNKRPKLGLSVAEPLEQSVLLPDFFTD